jgi:hypothetical protein
VDFAHDRDKAAEILADVTGPVPEPDNAVLLDTSWMVRIVGPVFLLFSVALIPWSIFLGVTLPERAISHRYNIAWAGFDVMLLLALGATGYFALRRSRYLAVAAAAAATLLVVDAWFDCMTASVHDYQLLESVLMAVILEIPLAIVCAWLSYHTEHLGEQRIIDLLRGRIRRSQRS